MAGALSGLKQIAELAHPNTLVQLRRAGAVSPRMPIALARAFPWLIGRGPSLGIVSAMNAVVVGDKPALHDHKGTLTWLELDQSADQTARALYSLGLSGGDRVAMLLRNGREFAQVALGGQKAGIIVYPLNTWAKPKELATTLEGTKADVLVYDTAHAEQVAEGAPKDLPLVFVGDSAKALEGSIDFDDWVSSQRATPLPFLTRNRGIPHVVIHTSGTTGKPKGAARDSSAAGLGALANLLSVVPYRRDDVVVCPAPLFHSFGLATLTFVTALGSTIVLPEKFDAEESLSLIEKHGATAASFVPVMLRRVVSLDEKVKSRYDLSSLRVVLISGSALSSDLRNGAVELFGDVLYDLYGSTEIGWVAIATPEDMKAKPKSVGRPVRGTEIAIFSDDGQKLGPGEIGEIYVKSKILFEGYTSGEKKDEREGYTSIGDTGRVDDDGYLFIEGRADDMVVIGGENVYPIEIEEVIESISGVEEASVVGIEDEEYGQVLAAFVGGKTTPEEVIETCKGELASYKVPRRVEVLDELPRTGSGKVIKRELVGLLDIDAEIIE